MNKMFVYGCSFTAGNGCLFDDEYCKKYRKTDDDLIWSEIISKKLGNKLFNYGMGGISNDKIFDSLIDTYHLIGENDIVILQSTFHHRFDIPNKNKTKLITIAPNPENIIKNEYSKQEINNIEYFSTLMDDELYRERYLNRFNFFKKILIENKKISKCIIWEIQSIWDNFDLIKFATNNEINDMHWSYKGHLDFSNYMLKKIEFNE